MFVVLNEVPLQDIGAIDKVYIFKRYLWWKNKILQRGESYYLCHNCHILKISKRRSCLFPPSGLDRICCSEVLTYAVNNRREFETLYGDKLKCRLCGSFLYMFILQNI